MLEIWCHRCFTYVPQDQWDEDAVSCNGCEEDHQRQITSAVASLRKAIEHWEAEHGHAILSGGAGCRKCEKIYAACA